MFGLNKYDSLKLRIGLLENELKVMREVLYKETKEPVYTQIKYIGYTAPTASIIETTEYTFTELVNLMLKHTGMQLSKEITPAKTEIKLTKVKKVK